MRNGFYDGKPQQMNFPDGLPKGMKIILKECGVDTRNMTADKMHKVLGRNCDF